MTISSADNHALVICEPPVRDRHRYMSALAADIELSLASDKLCLVILVEIDGFRHLQHAYGFEVADSIIARVHALLADSIKKASLVMPIADGMFAINIPELPSTQLIPVACEKIRSIVGIPFNYGDSAIALDCSIGVAVAPQITMNADSLLLAACNALDYARKSDECFSIIETAEDQQGQTERALKDELVAAIANGELTLRYQPKVSLDTLKPAGCEVLIRWSSPKYGDISPAEFIPLAESSELICLITEWVVMSAAREMRASGLPEEQVKYAINLSARDIAGGNLIGTLDSARDIWGVDHRHMSFEITEGAVMEDPETSIANIERLLEMGYSISLDDFGTGYSSIAYLKKIPAREIKIDQSFIRGLVDDPASLAIVKSIIDLSSHFSMSTIAEGVEDLPTLRLLMELGCQNAQGFYFARPMQCEDYVQWLADYDMSRYFRLKDAI